MLRRACRAWMIWCSSPACSKRRASAAAVPLPLQAGHQAPDVPPQQLVRRAHRLPVRRPVDAPQAGGAAAPHLGVEAALPLPRRRQRPAAAAQLEEAIDELQGLLRRAPAPEGAVVAGPVRRHPIGQLQVGERLLRGEAEEGVVGVLPAQDVVRREVGLDQLRLQDQGLHLGAHGEPLHLPGVGDHRPRLAVEPGRRDEVGGQALAQGDRLADVEDVPRLVPEDVAAGGQGGLAHGRAGGPQTPPLQHPRGPRRGQRRPRARHQTLRGAPRRSSAPGGQ